MVIAQFSICYASFITSYIFSIMIINYQYFTSYNFNSIEKNSVQIFNVDCLNDKQKVDKTSQTDKTIA